MEDLARKIRMKQVGQTSECDAGIDTILFLEDHFFFLLCFGHLYCYVVHTFIVIGVALLLCLFT